MHKFIKKSILGTIGLGATALIGGSVYLYKQAVGISKAPVTLAYDMINVVDNDPWENEKIWYQSVDREIITIQSTDQLNLSGLLIEQTFQTKKIAIIAHGYSGTHKEMAPFAKLFYDLGFSLLLPDARGHGDSDGNYIGFGWPERKDYLLWIKEIISRFGDDIEIALYGISMGGATVLNVSGETLEPQVKAIVEDCGYTSVSAELGHQLKMMYRLPSYPFIPLTSLLTKVSVGYSFGEASPLAQVKKSNLPTLFIHGEADDFVPTKMVYQLFEALKAPKELYVVPGAEHAYGYVTNKEEYRFRVSRFLNAHLNADVSFNKDKTQ